MNKPLLVKLLHGGAGAILIAATATSVLSAVGDDPKNAVQASATVQPGAIADSYKILMTRSMFSKDGKPLPQRPRFAWQPHPADTQPTTNASASEVAPEAIYVLKGVAVEDGVFTAFFEQTLENKGVRKLIGEDVARGSVAAMTLDGIDFLMDGKTRRISIGQALDGHVVDTQPSSSETPGVSGAPSWWGHHSTSVPGGTAPTPGYVPPMHHPGESGPPNGRPGDGPRPTGSPDANAGPQHPATPAEGAGGPPQDDAPPDFPQF